MPCRTTHFCECDTRDRGDLKPKLTCHPERSLARAASTSGVEGPLTSRRYNERGKAFSPCRSRSVRMPGNRIGSADRSGVVRLGLKPSPRMTATGGWELLLGGILHNREHTPSAVVAHHDPALRLFGQVFPDCHSPA